MSATHLASVGGGKLEYRWFEPEELRSSTCIVMLHEGLGSVAMWKDFPQRVASSTGMRVMAYSRFGYGRSDPVPAPYAVLEMQEREATEVLPALLEALGIDRPVLLGHSDGASMALIHAAFASKAVAGVVAMAPHTFVEDKCIASIEAARHTYLTTDLRERLAPYHDDPDRAFWSWNDLWLNPAFRRWNVERHLPSITCPVLAIQGYDDEYGTMQQLESIARAVPQATFMKLESCRHSPHRDQPEAVLHGLQRWLMSSGI